MNKKQQERLRGTLLGMERQNRELRKKGYSEAHYLRALAIMESLAKNARLDIYNIGRQMNLDENGDH